MTDSGVGQCPEAAPPDEAVATVDYVFPDRYQDYTDEDWEALDAEAEKHLAELTETVYGVLCWRCYGLGWWKIDPQYGLQELVFYATDDEGRTKIEEWRQRERLGGDGWQAVSMAVASLFEDTHTVLNRLVADGRVELAMRESWPAFRPTAGWVGIASSVDGDIARGRLLRQRELETMDYRTYLASPEWRATRTEKVAEAGGRCELCNSPDSLHVHHRTYERRGNERTSDLTVLCRVCHEAYHRRNGAR